MFNTVLILHKCRHRHYTCAHRHTHSCMKSHVGHSEIYSLSLSHLSRSTIESPSDGTAHWYLCTDNSITKKSPFPISQDARPRPALILCQFALEWWTLKVGNQLRWGLVVICALCGLQVVVLLKHKSPDRSWCLQGWVMLLNTRIYQRVCTDRTRLLISICP